MGSSPVGDPDFGALDSEMATGEVHPARDEDGDRDEDEAQHRPRG